MIIFKPTLVLGLASVWLIMALNTVGTSHSASQGTDNLSPATCTTKNSSCPSTANHHGLANSSAEDEANGEDVPGTSVASSVDHRDRAHKFFTNLDLFNGELTVAELELTSITSRHLYNIYDEVSIQRYDSYAMFQQSTGPHLDQELCIRRLEQLNARADLWLQEKSHSLDLNLYRLLDSYGRISAGVTANHIIWPGMYASCLEMRIDSPEGPTPTRYCMASLRRKSWPQTDIMSKDSAFKSGVCLPKACDSTRYRNKFELIDRLMSFNAREVDRNQTVLHDLFCLPDEDSPLRNWWRSPMVVVAIVVCGIWLAVLAYATIKYEQWEAMKSVNSHSTSGHRKSNGRMGTGSSQKDEQHKMYQSLAITANLKALLRTERPVEAKAEVDPETQVDFNCLGGIKVICMWYIILGHVVMSLSTIAVNTREVAGSLTPTWIISNMMPAFAVNAFFTITGILTYHLLLKQNKLHTFMTSPIKWSMIIIYRYLRIMPVYAIVVYYCKYIGKFTGAGPMWDYGTSSLAGRRRCEQESWLWTLLFGANLKSPFHHCVPSAWYLANDFQFFLVTPIFMIALHRDAQLGKRLLKLCIVASYLAGIRAVSLVDADLRPIAEFMPHGFATYVTLFSSSYTFPHYRIASYLIGLLLGFYLHEYEQKKRLVASLKGSMDHSAILDEPQWPQWLIRSGPRIFLVFFILLVLGPVSGPRLQLSKPVAHAAVAFAIPTYHISFALVTGLYILLAATGHGNKLINRFLSSSLWKPPARLSLCVVLVNIEVIGFMCLNQKRQVDSDFYMHSAANLMSIASSYLVAAVVYIVFEAPIKGISGHLLSGLFR